MSQKSILPFYIYICSQRALCNELWYLLTIKKSKAWKKSAHKNFKIFFPQDLSLLKRHFPPSAAPFKSPPVSKVCRSMQSGSQWKNWPLCATVFSLFSVNSHFPTANQAHAASLPFSGPKLSYKTDPLFLYLSSEITASWLEVWRA